MKIRNKNAIMELLGDRQVQFEKIVLAENLEKDSLTRQIIVLASNRQIPIEKMPRKKISKRRTGENHEVLVGYLAPIKLWRLDDLLAHLYNQNEKPFFLLLNRVNFDVNIGVIARTAFAAGVNGLIFQTEQDRFLNEDTVHFSIGAIARLPLIKMNVFEAIKELRKNGIKVFSLQMGGKNYFAEKLSGPVSFLVGSEKEGASDTISDKCDGKLSLPMREGIDSINVSSSISAVLYEKVRQEQGRFL